MSGHSKWSQIKRQKGANDAKRGQVFTKVGREITIAAREGGPDPDANHRLRLAIEKARSVNMPADNIKRAIEKAAGGSGAEQYEEIVYEGYGPGGVAVMVEVVTDNRNRTVGEIRFLLSKYGGNLGETGCVGWMFDKKYSNIDYYNFWVFATHVLAWAQCDGMSQPRRREKLLARVRQTMAHFPHFFSSDGGYSEYGRSLARRIRRNSRPGRHMVQGAGERFHDVAGRQRHGQERPTLPSGGWIPGEHGVGDEAADLRPREVVDDQVFHLRTRTRQPTQVHGAVHLQDAERFVRLGVAASVDPSECQLGLYVQVDQEVGRPAGGESSGDLFARRRGDVCVGDRADRPAVGHHQPGAVPRGRRLGGAGALERLSRLFHSSPVCVEKRFIVAV
jgi:hypothetical protein